MGRLRSTFGATEPQNRKNCPQRMATDPAVCVVAGWYRRHDEYDKD